MQTNVEEVTQSKRIECIDYATQTFPIFMKSKVLFMGKSLCAIRYVRGRYVKVETAMGHLMRHSFKFRVDAILEDHRIRSFRKHSSRIPYRFTLFGMLPSRQTLNIFLMTTMDILFVFHFVKTFNKTVNIFFSQVYTQIFRY